MTTASALIVRARTNLLNSVVERRNKIAGAIDADDTTVTMWATTHSITEGTVIEVDAELMYVWSVSGSVLTVERGWEGSTAAAHADGALVTVSPRFPTYRLFAALNDDIQSLSSQSLFKVVTVDATYSGHTPMLEIPSATSVLRILTVQYRDSTDDWRPVLDFKLVRNQKTTDITSGFALVFHRPVPTGPIRIQYASEFTRLTALTDDVTTAGGVPATCDDILMMGVQIRALASRESTRSFTEAQGDTRRADEVPAGAIAQSMTPLMRLRDKRIAEESARLKRMYPQRIR